MEHFKNLTDSENKALLKFPVYISLLAANVDGKMDEAEKKEAIKFSHIKTYSADVLLVGFYKEADAVFENNISQLDNALPKEKNSRESAIKYELSNLEKLVLKLGDEDRAALHHSMRTFKEHVSQAHHSVLVDFIFPIPTKGLTY
jgi:tellurite resistance protein